MQRKLLPLAALAALIAVAALMFFYLRVEPQESAAGSSDGGAKAGVPTPKRMSSTGSGPVEPPPISMEADPKGDLRLEGQVIDEHDDPVAGAEVRVSSNPPRTVKSGEDGTFAVSELIGKTYYVSARKGDLVGGPVRRALTETSDPVVIRMVQGAAVHVTVLDAASSGPVEGARVYTDDHSELTGEDGRVELRGLAAGYETVRVQATGYAPARELVQIPSQPGVEVDSVIKLHTGAAVSGRVLDDEGGPIEGARVVAQDASAVFSLAGAEEGVLTDGEGRFSIPTVAAGTYRFVATHEGHPPGSSRPVALDGEHETTDVEIILPAGARLAGRVLDSAGSPVAWATVRVQTRQATSQGWNPGLRGATSEEDGTFEVTGLPRGEVTVAARSETASSELEELDLTERSEITDLVLRLSVEGALSGFVIDGQGEPVADAQVIALPDFWGGGDVEGFMLHGTRSQSTDGGGGFTFRGLPEGKYRLHATRSAARSSNFWQQKGTPARTGDTDVELVLLEQGSLRGRLQYDDGSAPDTFTVSVGYPPGVPVADDGGEFSIPSVPPGTHDVTFRGPGFAETVRRDVEIEPGQENDLGTVTVKRGRSVSGRVLDPSGAPIANATVVVGRQVVGNGKSVSESTFGAAADEMMGIRRGKSDESGAYRLTGISTHQKQVLVAEHPERGRSSPVEVPPGPESMRFDLVARPFGSAAGKVRLGGEPQTAQVIATAAGSMRQSVMVTSGSDGNYKFERLPEGTYSMTAIVGAGIGSGRSGSAEATVRGGQETRADIEIEAGDIALEVVVTGEGGAKVDAAQVFMFSGAVRATNAEDIQRAYTSSGGSAMNSFAMGGKPAVLEGVTAGLKSICLIPLSGDMSDPTFMRRVQESAMHLDVHCRQHRVTETPQKQTFRTEVPPMSPLPEPPDDE